MISIQNKFNQAENMQITEKKTIKVSIWINTKSCPCEKHESKFLSYFILNYVL